MGGVLNGQNLNYVIFEMSPRTDKSRKKIFGSYHASTGIFAGLSLVSYFIPPDIVPGRMGMLITLFLILINSYNSVDAPPDRGNIRYQGQSQEFESIGASIHFLCASTIFKAA